MSVAVVLIAPVIASSAILWVLILEHLHPIDLYHFSQTAKLLRRIIMNPLAIGVWRTTFARHPDLPKCPPVFDEPKWTFMLFGPGICLECGKFGALTDFAFNKQYCELCMKEKYACAQHLRDSTGRTIPLNHMVTSMVPRTFRYHGLRYTTSYATLSNAKYLRKDFDVMMKKVTLIQLLIDHNVPMLATLFEDYRYSLAIHVQKMERFADGANNWAVRIFSMCSLEHDGAVAEVTKICKKRLQALGHDVVDIDYVHYSILQSLRGAQIYRLTCRGFRAIRPKLEALVTAQKVKRIKKERRQLLETRYTDYQRTLAPDSWQYQPPSYFLHGTDVEVFSDFLNANFDARGDISQEFANSQFPGLAEKWKNKRQLQILSLFAKVEVEKNFEKQLEKLELATSVITCGNCKYMNQEGRALLGWNNICRHLRRTVSGNTIPCSSFEIIDSVALAAATSLVMCIGLDPKTTTIENMNSRNDRFLCGNCVPETSRGVTGLKAYTWIESITHSMDMHLSNNVTHDPPLWFLLTAEATRFVREQEYAYPRPTSTIWRCDLCPAHYDEGVTQKKAINHVKEAHLINHPLIGGEVKCDQRYFSKRRKQFRLGLDPAYEFKCKRCPDIPICKLWEMSNLTTHLRVKHKVMNPTQDGDWIKVQLIA